MQPGAPGAWNPQGGAPPAGYGQQQQPGGYGQAPAPGGYAQAPAPGGYGQQPQQQQPGGFGQMTGGAGAAAAALQKGFVGAMFDFSFNNYIAPKIIKILYGVWILFSVLVLIGGVGAGFMQMASTYGSAAVGFVQILLAPFAAVLMLIIGRIYMEILIVLFKIVENLNEINRKTKE
jgi:hypothetical protein